MGLVLITNDNKHKYLQQITDLEQQAEYPLGRDFFKIDHGPNYFRFFERLGRLRYYVWVEDGGVAAVAAGILRDVPVGKRWQRAWYLSDLKVHPDFRNRKIPKKMLTRAFLPNYLRCQRCYAISMNAPNEEKNKTSRILERFKWMRVKEVSKLNLWSLSDHDLPTISSIAQKHRGPIRYLSLKGIKDIILKSSGLTMPIYHWQFGPLADPHAVQNIEPGGTHMFCAPESDILSIEIKSAGLSPSASATVLAHNMAKSDWAWVLTSDI